MNLNELEFKPEDFAVLLFGDSWPIGDENGKVIATVANRLLRERLAKAVEVYGMVYEGNVIVPFQSRMPEGEPSNHKARLVCVEEI